MRTLLTIALVACIAGTGFADTLVHVYVNGVKKDLEPQARVRDGATFAPLRAAANAVGASVKWNAQTQTATISKGGKTTNITKSQGIVVKDQLLVPLRLMAEALGAQVSWDGAAKAVMINTRAGGEGTTEGTEPPKPKDEGTSSGEGTG